MSPVEPEGSAMDVVKAFHAGVQHWLAMPEQRQLPSPVLEKALPGCQDAIKGLVSSLEAANVPPAMLEDVSAAVEAILALSLQAQAARTDAYPEHLEEEDDATCCAKLGVSVAHTGLRRPSTSYRLFDRMGGWETLSAAVEGVYRRLSCDDRVGHLPPGAEQRLKADMLAFMTAAFAGKVPNAEDRDSAALENSSLWRNHQQVSDSLGLLPNYFACMIQHLQEELDELGLPHDDIEQAINLLKASRPIEPPRKLDRTTSENVVPEPVAWPRNRPLSCSGKVV